MSTDGRRGELPDARHRSGRAARVVAIIPARFQSSRFPGKALADLCGKPMIVHVYERARRARSVDAVIVATDDARIASAVRAAGGAVHMTSDAHKTGTDRIAEVAHHIECDIVVNPQGDEPLIEPAMIDEVVAPLVDEATLPMATLRRPITARADYESRHVVKVVTSLDGDALYFSRAAIPTSFVEDGPLPACHAHVGLYAFRRDALLHLAALPQTVLERAESLEQLRALEHGMRIRVVTTRHTSIGVDTPEDLERAREQLVLASPRIAHASQ